MFNMKFTVFAALLTAASALKANSSAGKSLLSKSRALEDGGDQDQDQEQDYSWIIDYSLQFDSCHTIEQFNFGGDDEGSTSGQSTLVKFKLCPSGGCGNGCNGAEYLAPMADFVNSYTEWQMNDVEYKCEQIRENCVCSDDVDDETCESSCYAANGMTDSCVEEENDVSRRLCLHRILSIFLRYKCSTSGFNI
jgi:hypothetical protein